MSKVLINLERAFPFMDNMVKPCKSSQKEAYGICPDKPTAGPFSHCDLFSVFCVTALEDKPCNHRLVISSLHWEAEESAPHSALLFLIKSS